MFISTFATFPLFANNFLRKERQFVFSSIPKKDNELWGIGALEFLVDVQQGVGSGCSDSGCVSAFTITITIVSSGVTNVFFSGLQRILELIGPQDCTPHHGVLRFQRHIWPLKDTTLKFDTHLHISD